MGNFILNSILKNYDFYHMHSLQQQWQTLSTQSSLKLSPTLIHKHNPSLKAQLHQSLHVDNLQQSLKILQFRKTYQKHPIVGIFGVYLPKKYQTTFNICGQFHNYSLVTQHMPFCFSDIGLIQFPNGIHILKNVFSAAKLIKQKINITTLYDENMIFFDNQNKCKLWINEDTSQNKPNHYEHTLQLQSLQSIFATIEMKIKHSQSFQNYLKMKEQFKLTTFAQAINFVHNFQSQELRLTKITNFNESRLFDSGCKNVNKNSPIKAQKVKVKKSLSSQKKIIQNKKSQNYSSIKKFNYNLEFQSNLSTNSSIIFTLQLPPKNQLKCQQKNILQNKSYLKHGQWKRQELKKQKLRKIEVNNKFYSTRLIDMTTLQKPTFSSISTNQQSQIEHKNTSSIRFQNLKTQHSQLISQSTNKINKIQINANNCGQNSNKYQKVYKNNNEKLSLSQYHNKLKKNVSLPFI